MDKVKKITPKVKGKPTMKVNMADHAKKNFPSNDKFALVGDKHQGGNDTSYNQESLNKRNEQIEKYNALLKSWNENPESIDKEYQVLTPMNGIVVRMFHIEMEKSGDILKPVESIVVVPTANGMGVHHTTASPYQYDTVGVVVSVSTQYSQSMKPGQIISVKPEVVAARTAGKDAPFELALWVAHPRWRKHQAPTDIEHDDYGYLLIDPRAHGTFFLNE